MVDWNSELVVENVVNLIHPERTLVLVKPDGVSRGLVGEIFGRLERAGLRIVALSMRTPSSELARDHYRDAPEDLRRMGSKLTEAAASLGADPQSIFGTTDVIELGRVIHARNIAFLRSGPVVAAVIQGVNAIRKVRELCGATMPIDAQAGSIRGDFSSVGVEQVLFSEATVYNLVHSSDESLGSATREVELWFPEGIFSSGTDVWPAIPGR
jgi:nucleoside-diphosphate kinase